MSADAVAGTSPQVIKLNPSDFDCTKNSVKFVVPVIKQGENKIEYDYVVK
jgi:hypothetical protein